MKKCVNDFFPFCTRVWWFCAFGWRLDQCNNLGLWEQKAKTNINPKWTVCVCVYLYRSRAHVYLCVCFMFVLRSGSRRERLSVVSVQCLYSRRTHSRAGSLQEVSGRSQEVAEGVRGHLTGFHLQKGPRSCWLCFAWGESSSFSSCLTQKIAHTGWVCCECSKFQTDTIKNK